MVRHVSLIRLVITKFILPLAFCATSLAQSQTSSLPALKVSKNQRYLETSDGKPFFYMADTGWELFHRLTREDASKYLETRASQGFTVIQAVALAEFDGLNAPNAYGHRPLVDNDPTKPEVKDGPENDYWDHVDFILTKAESLGMYVAFLPTWGDKWNKKWGAGPEIFTPENASVYGEWLGKRYARRALIWVLGGDRPPDLPMHRDVIRAMAEGLKKGDGGAHLRTFHPPGGTGSADWFHGESWLDFNMRQNGHSVDYDDRYAKTLTDYKRLPVKPVIDAEPIYEDHPVSFDAKKHGHSLAADVRRAIWWDLMAGSCGFTYGNHSIWQFWQPGREPVNTPLMTWQEALDRPGGRQMQHARKLMEARSFATLVPDDSLIVPTDPPTALPGAGSRRITAARDKDGSFAVIYAPVGRAFEVNTRLLSGERLRAWWFNPRMGKATQIGEFSKAKLPRFIPPDEGELLDWILVLDDIGKPLKSLDG